MNSSDTGKDKIKKICEILQTEALVPAQQEAAALVTQAQQKAHMLLEEATKQAQDMVDAAKLKIEKERGIFEQSVRHAFQGIKEQLRQEIETTLLRETFTNWVQAHTSHALAASKLISALVEMVREGGMDGDFTALVSKNLQPEEVNALLGEQILRRLREGQVVVGNFQGGVCLKLHAQRITLDLSDAAIIELLTNYISKEFREIIFQPVGRT